MSIRVITPTDYLSWNVSSCNLFRFNPAKDEDLKAESRRVLHKNLHRLRGSNGQRFFIVAANQNPFLVLNPELYRSNRANTLVLQLAKPLMRHLEISQDGRGIDTMNLRAPICRANT